MQTANKLFLLLSMTIVVLAQTACSKQEQVATTSAAPADKPVVVATAKESPASAPKAMDMPMGTNAQGATDKMAMHHASGVVKEMDATKGTVTLAHGPVATLKWPAMTMTFKVNDKALMAKLGTDKKVDVDFMKEGSDYVVTDVK